jgi:hypothetical protein
MNNNSDKSTKNIFEKIVLNDIIYYVDKQNRLWNSNAKIVGYLVDPNEKKYILL